jgi:uncharacterized membrane protein
VAALQQPVARSAFLAQAVAVWGSSRGAEGFLAMVRDPGYRDIVEHRSAACVQSPDDGPGKTDTMTATANLDAGVQKTEEQLLEQLRRLRRDARLAASGKPGQTGSLTFGQRIADRVAASMGSWPFIIIQSFILAVWIVLNVTAWVAKWDPYPFILLNLALSFQAAYAAPFIMMSQNRQQDIDREAAKGDYEVNIKAELEIELLHQKIDRLREEEVVALTQAVRDLIALVTKLSPAVPLAE